MKKISFHCLFLASLTLWHILQSAFLRKFCNNKDKKCHGGYFIVVHLVNAKTSLKKCKQRILLHVSLSLLELPRRPAHDHQGRQTAEDLLCFPLFSLATPDENLGNFSPTLIFV